MWQKPSQKSSKNKNQQAKNVWLVIFSILIIILAIIFFGKAYWQKQESSLVDERQLFEQINDLRGQVTDLQKKLSKKEEPEEAIKQILITRDDASKIDDCDNQKINTELADKTVAYLNKEKNITLDVPYNETWGTEKYLLGPYEEIKSEENVTLEFGPLITFGSKDNDGCFWNRKYSLTFLLKQSSAKALTEIKEMDKLISEPEEKEIVGYSVIEYKMEDNLLDNPSVFYVIRVLGDEETYEIKQIIEPWLSSIPDFKALENIVETLKPLGE